MGLGIDWMIWVAQFVASLPGAVGRIVAFGIGPLLLCTLGLLLLCLLRSHLRWCGAAVIAAAAFWAFRTPEPDVYVGNRRRRGRGARGLGRLSVCARAATPSRCANGSRPTPMHEHRPIHRSGWRELRRVRLRRAAARWRDRCAAVRRGGLRGGLPPCGSCREPAHRAAVVRGDCIDRTVWQRTGRDRALSVRRRVERVVACPAGYDRPWARAAATRGEGRSNGHLSAARCHAADGGSQRGRLSVRSILPEQTRPACPGCARGWAAGCAPHRRCSRAPARSRRRGGGSA